MIRRPRVLNPTEVPDQELIVHRGKELEDVTSAARRLARGNAPAPFVLHGPPGTGKTMVAKYVLRHRLPDPVRTAYVDCWENYDDYHLLAQVVDGLGLEVVHHNSTPIADLRDALATPADQPRLVVLDELEMVRDTDALATLADAPGLTVVGIVNNRDVIRDRVTDAWGDLAESQFLEFKPYSVRAVAEIVAVRAEHGLQGSVLSDARAERIGELAAGDARLGICILRAAAREAADSPTISPSDIEAGAERAYRELHQAALDRLTAHQRVLYDLIREHGPCPPGEVVERYTAQVDDPRSETTVRDYLRKMEWYGLLAADGSTRDRTYRIDDSGYVPA